MNYPNPVPRLNRTGAVRKRAGAPQLRAAVQDVSEELATKMKCNTHLCEYYVPQGDKAECPACVLEQKYADLRNDYMGVVNESDRMKLELHAAKAQLEIGTAIRSALEILGDEDYAWLKVQLYQYKVDKSVVLKPTHGRLENGRKLKRGEKMPANGFMAVPRKGDPEAHLCTSLGGIAMAGYFDEAVTCYGSAQGMGIMLKAWWTALPGAQS